MDVFAIWPKLSKKIIKKVISNRKHQTLRHCSDGWSLPGRQKEWVFHSGS